MAINLEELAGVGCCTIVPVRPWDTYVACPLPEVDLQVVLLLQDTALQWDRVRMPRHIEALQRCIPRYEPVPVQESMVRMQHLAC